MDLYWHFVSDDLKLRDGQKLECRKYVLDGKPVMCRRGYHASRRAIDALRYAPGAVVCRVTLGGTIIEDTDKLVATERTVLWYADATNTLHEFACRCAEKGLTYAKVDDKRCWNAIRTKRNWLQGEATGLEVTLAREEAWEASRDAVNDGARYLGHATARASASDDASYAASGAALAAARAASWYANCRKMDGHTIGGHRRDGRTMDGNITRESVRAEQNTMLEEMLVGLEKETGIDVAAGM